MRIEDRLRQHVRDQARRVTVTLPPLDEVVVAAQTRRLRRTVAAVAVLALVFVAVLALIARSAPPPIDVVQTPPSSVEAVLLDGSVLRLRLPSGLQVDPSTLEMSGSLYASPTLDDVRPTTRNWRLDVTHRPLDEVLPDGDDLLAPTADAARLGYEGDMPKRLALAFGSWTAMVTGDDFGAGDPATLLESIDFEVADSTITYTGSLALWQVDGPTWRIAGDGVELFVHLRSCAGDPERRSASGIPITIASDPARGSPYVTTLCPESVPIEIWVGTEEPLDDRDLDVMDIEVLLAGPVLSAVQEGWSPQRENPDGDALPIETFLHDWTAPDGSSATRSPRDFELHTLQGAEHCNWQTVVSITVPWPLGTTFRAGPDGDLASARVYVRDPGGVASHLGLLGDLDLDTDLPAGARATGYRLPTVELWLGPDEGHTYVYLRTDDGHVERWPRANAPLACA